MSDDIANRLIDYDDNYKGEPPVDITWAVGQREPYVVDTDSGMECLESIDKDAWDKLWAYAPDDPSNVFAIVIVPTADGE